VHGDTITADTVMYTCRICRL